MFFLKSIIMNIKILWTKEKIFGNNIIKLKNEEDKFKILSKTNDIQPKIKELRKYDKYCRSIQERAKTIQENINNFDKDIQKEKDNSRSL